MSQWIVNKRTISYAPPYNPPYVLQKRQRRRIPNEHVLPSGILYKPRHPGKALRLCIREQLGCSIINKGILHRSQSRSGTNSYTSRRGRLFRDTPQSFRIGTRERRSKNALCPRNRTRRLATVMTKTTLDAACTRATTIASLLATFAAFASFGATSPFRVSDPPGRHWESGLVSSCEG